MINNYMDLDVWNLAHECVIEIYKTTKMFPSDEKYGLISQIQRAAYSIPANIAEGNGRQHLKEYINFLFISKSSLNELKYFLLLSKDLGYLNISKHNELDHKIDRVGMMLIALIKALKRKLDS